MKSTKDELLLECIKQFEHIENVLEYNRLASTKSLINEIEQALRIHDVVGRSEQLPCDDCVDGQKWSPYYGKYVECDCSK